VVVAGCTPRHYGEEFEAVMRRVGLDPRLLARVNLREQAVYPHRGDGAGQAGKARALVGMAVAGLKAMAGVAALAAGERRALTRRALVVGGGAAGMAAALALAGLEIPADLVEREQVLGGQWRQLRYQADGREPQAELAAWQAAHAGEDGSGPPGAQVQAHWRAAGHRSVVADGRDEEWSTGWWWSPRGPPARRRNTCTANTGG
jgi:hypothetical protein